MTELSPAARAVLDAINKELDEAPWDLSFLAAASAAAALRAAADEVIPLTKTPWGTTLVPVFSAQESRDRLLAIANELEAQ